MKKLFALALLTISTASIADSVVVNGTRFIYPSKEKEITIQLTNNATTPALIQTWLDNGDASASPDEIVTPFTITPPVTRIDGKAGQSLRIRAANRAGIATDRESLWYLNILEVPPTVKGSDTEHQSKLMMAIRSRFKFIYRPVGLGSPVGATKQLSITPNGKMVKIDNPTPFYITIKEIVKGNNHVANDKAEMVAPKSTKSFSLQESVSKGESLKILTLNDYGAIETNVLTAK